MKSDLKNNSINYLEVDLAGDGRKLSDEVAEILSIDWDENLFLGTDLGSVLLFSFVSSKQTDCLVKSILSTICGYQLLILVKVRAILALFGTF